MELLKIKPTNIIPQTHNLLKSLSEKFCQELSCACVSLICASQRIAQGSALVSIMWSPTELLGCTWHAQNVLESAEHLLFFVVSVLPNFSLSLFFPSTLSLWITSSDAILIRVSVRKCSWCCRAHRRSQVDAARG